MNVVGYIREYGGESSGIYFGFMRAITSYRNVCFFNWFFRGGFLAWVVEYEMESLTVRYMERLNLCVWFDMGLNKTCKLSKTYVLIVGGQRREMRYRESRWSSSSTKLNAWKQKGREMREKERAYYR